MCNALEPVHTDKIGSLNSGRDCGNARRARGALERHLPTSARISSLLKLAILPQSVVFGAPVSQDLLDAESPKTTDDLIRS